MGRTSIADAFAGARLDGRGTLIAYLTMGHPSASSNLRAIEIIGASGADVIEIGWPAARPYLDGPIIRASHKQAMAAFAVGVDSPKTVLARAAQVTDRPLVLMGYKNELMAIPDVLPGCLYRGEIAGVLIPDADTDELKRIGVQGQPGLFDPAMDAREIERAAMEAHGFAYVRTGVGCTGRQADLSHGDLSALAGSIRRSRPDLPVAIGFGLSTPEDVARSMALGFDGAIVGSAIVRYINDQDWTGLALFVSALAASAASSRRPAAEVKTDEHGSHSCH